MGVTTPQQNDCLGPNSLKSIVFLKVALTDHAFLHVFDMLEGWVLASLSVGRQASWPSFMVIDGSSMVVDGFTPGFQRSSMGPPRVSKVVDGRRWVVDGRRWVVDGHQQLLDPV